MLANNLNAIEMYFVTKKAITITQGYRLRNVNMGHFDAYFDISCSYDIKKQGYIFVVKYLPNTMSDPRKLYHKSSTNKAGDFITIKDICELKGIPEPKKGKGYRLEIIEENTDLLTNIYFLPETEISKK